MAYFSEVSDILYQSQHPNRNSSDDYVRVKNLFRRAKLREDLFNSTTAFTKYKIIGNERPEQVSQKFYNSPEYDWVVLVTNNIINIRQEWPVSNEEFNRYLERKYTQEELSAVDHYETLDFYDYNGKKIVKAGRIVDQDFSVSYFDSGVKSQFQGNSDRRFDSTSIRFDSTEITFDSTVELVSTNGIVRTVSPIKPVTVYEVELKQNEEKRNIYVLKPRYLQAVIDDLREIMSYGFSSQYINDKTKKGDSSRTISFS